MTRVGLLIGVLVVFAPAKAMAEWQIKPFFGVTLGGTTTYVLTDPAGRGPSVILGGNTTLLGEIFGVEGDFSYAPGFFHSGIEDPTTANGQIISSGVTTLTGNVVIAMPRHLTEYSLRLYFVGGAGMIRVSIDGANGGLVVTENLPGMDLGGGATGFLTKRIGLNWDVRRFRSFSAIDERNSLSPVGGPEPLSFWRASMSVAIRY